jgi:hypothetical protein
MAHHRDDIDLSGFDQVDGARIDLAHSARELDLQSTSSRFGRRQRVCVAVGNPNKDDAPADPGGSHGVAKSIWGVRSFHNERTSFAVRRVDQLVKRGCNPCGSELRSQRSAMLKGFDDENVTGSGGMKDL